MLVRYVQVYGAFYVAPSPYGFEDHKEAEAASVACNAHDALVAENARLREALERVSPQWHYAHPIDYRGRAAYQNCEHLDCAQARAALKAAV